MQEKQRARCGEMAAAMVRHSCHAAVGAEHAWEHQQEQERKETAAMRRQRAARSDEAATGRAARIAKIANEETTSRVNK